MKYNIKLYTKIIIGYLSYKIKNKIESCISEYLKKQIGFCGKNVVLSFPAVITNKKNLFMDDNSYIFSGFKLISYTGKFYFGKNSGASQGLTVITGNHNRTVGILLRDDAIAKEHDIERDVTVEEDVWIGANVTLLNGCHIGRGAVIGANSVVRNNVPPYAIVIGNPARIVGFTFTPEELKLHEEKLYEENDRTSLEDYEKKYNYFFIKRMKNIKEFVSLSS